MWIKKEQSEKQGEVVLTIHALLVTGYVNNSALAWMLVVTRKNKPI